MTQQQKDTIFEMAQEKQFTVNYSNGKKYLARLIGRKCDYPAVYFTNENGQSIDVQISWALASRLATGETNFITA